MSDTFQQAVARHQAGDLAAAAPLYRAVLAFDPAHADALHMLGALQLQRGDWVEALALFDRALALAPSAAIHSNRGAALRALGRLEEALASHDEAARLAPGLAPIHANRAEVLLALGRHAEVVESCDQALALRADHADTWARRGLALQILDRQQEALASYDQVLSLRPGDASAWLNRGVALQALGRSAEAIESYDRAMALEPSARAHVNKGNALYALERHAEAVASFDAAIGMGLDEASMWFTRGNALQPLERHADALASYDRALALQPDYVEAWNNRGNALRALTRYDDAIASYDHALALRPDSRQARVNKGNVLQIVNRHDTALPCYDAVLAAEPDHVDAHWNGALCRLALGDFAAGWREFEWRFELMPRRDYEAPLRLGQDFAPGTTILLHAEQGFGDTLQFCRYAPLLAARGARVVMEVQPPLKRLMATLEGVTLVAAQGEATGDFDLHCPLMSLPLAFGTTPETIPASVPYLWADPDAAARWRARLDGLPGLKVGLVWAGNPRSFNWVAAETDRRRSIALVRYAPLASVPGVTLVSLQKDAAGDQVRDAPAGMVIHDWTRELEDFADTAALVAGLDLVIGVDTSVVHVAGALGKPVWILNRHGACWRWFRNRNDTPWYPTARLFHQPSPGDWDSVIAEVRAALPAAVAARQLNGKATAGTGTP
jgi:tetratricopeptide (TPR) repeat protein